MYATPKSVIVHKKLLISLCKGRGIEERPKNPVRETGNYWPGWLYAGALCRSFGPGNDRRCERRKKGETTMKYIEMIAASFRSCAAVQTRLEDACVARWGFCLDGQH